MSLDPSVLRAMQNAGASMEVILAAIEAQAALDEERRQSLRKGNAERQRKRRHKVSQRDERDPPNDNISNPPSSSSSAKADAGSAFDDEIVSVWNETADRCGFRKAQALRGKRLTKLKARRKEFGEAKLLEGIARLSTSDWHTGKAGDWRATLGWFLHSEENVNKALEFDLPPAAAKPRTNEELAQEAERAAEKYEAVGAKSQAEEARKRAEMYRRKEAA